MLIGGKPPVGSRPRRALPPAGESAFHFNPSRECLPERRNKGLSFLVCFRICHQHADGPHTVGLLRACRQWPRRRTAEQRDEVASFHCPTAKIKLRMAFALSRPATSVICPFYPQYLP
jgi:hypothetical protein